MIPEIFYTGHGELIHPSIRPTRSMSTASLPMSTDARHRQSTPFGEAGLMLEEGTLGILSLLPLREKASIIGEAQARLSQKHGMNGIGLQRNQNSHLRRPTYEHRGQ